MKKIFVLIISLFITLPVNAWDGFDYERGHSIEIEQGQLVRPGEEIDVYNYNTGRYETYEVEDVNSDEVEVYNWETGTYRTFDMD